MLRLSLDPTRRGPRAERSEAGRLRHVTSYSRPVREVENVFIRLLDGCRLAARIWLPGDAEADPVPAILEYLPYRKRNGTAERDHLTHPYLAGHGYACVRVDMRGAGESDGVLLDEYLPQEQDDALEVLAWIAAQPWCTGRVGIIGISWGGFNGLQIAARRPPELAAVVTICSTDDRYADDIHFMGGCLLNDNLGWASTMFGIMTHPPDPALVGERWRAMWLERLENEPLLIADWLGHQRRDAFWKHGSVCEDFAAIRCPVYAVGGWADGYSNAVPRLLAGLSVPRKGLIGPWAHKYPHFAKPGPAIGFLQECLRWWDHWLKGIETGVMDGPAYRVWMEDWTPPRTHNVERPGRWVAEEAWPSPRVREEAWPLAPGRLGPDPEGTPSADLEVRSPQATGLAAGRWCPYGLFADQPGDQREDDGKSLVFDSAPLAADLEILGAPVAALEVAADRPVATVAVRLNDVAPDGASLRVSFGLLNLTHRESHEHPAPLEPGRFYPVGVKLNDIAHRFRAGHRVRLALSTAYWPIAWPAPEAFTLTLRVGGDGTSALRLPVRPPRAGDAELPAFPPPEGAPPQAVTVFRPASNDTGWTRDVATGETVVTVTDDEGHHRIDAHGLEYDGVRSTESRIDPDDPNSAVVTKRYGLKVGRGGWRVRTETSTTMRSTPDSFLLEASLEAYEGVDDRLVLSRVWRRTIPRDLV
jgi:uncharacterized protein